MNNQRLGIVGLGYVGTAVYEGFKDYYDIRTFDVAQESNCSNIDELIECSDYIFVAVPTPMNKDGSSNLDIVNNTVKQITNSKNVKNLSTKDLK